MARSIDWICTCGAREWAIAEIDETRTCACGAEMEQDWLPRQRRDAQWSDRDAVAVDITDDPSVPEDVRTRYIGSHEAKLKPGYRRIYLRSLQEVNRFEREHNVMNHRMHYDNNGRDLTDYQGSH